MLQVTFQPKEGNQTLWEVCVEGEKWREVHRSIFGRKPRLPLISDEKQLEAAFDTYEYGRVKGYVLWRLSKQSFHSEQLKKQLRDKSVPESTVDQVIEEFKRLNLLDDEAWMHSFARVQKKRYGLRLVRQKLQAKGFSRETIQKLTDHWEEEGEEEGVIDQLLKTRYRKKNLSDVKERQKVIASLIRKGFSYSQIEAALEGREGEIDIN